MSEEELKAIEYIGNTTYKFLEYPFCNINKVEMNLYDFKQIETLLNLITKQQKEIENSISKDKIREKIKDIEMQIKGEKTKKYTIPECLITLKILKELLGE